FGKVIKTYQNFSEIMLVSSKNSVVNVKVQEKNVGDVLGSGDATNEVDGVVKGKGGLEAYLDLIPISDTITPKDVLVTSAIDKSFPKDLLVATIVQKVKDDQKPFQQAQLQLF